MRVIFEPLDSRLHDRGAFSCGHDGVDRFFKQVASQAGDAFRSQTVVLVGADNRNEVLGFHTLAYHEYRDREMDAATAKALKVANLGRVPTILLAQLGVDRKQQGKRLGAMLLDDALRKSVIAAHVIGGVAVVTDPVDEKAASFYAKYDFQRLPECERMLIPMKTLKRAYPAVADAAKERAAALGRP